MQDRRERTPTPQDTRVVREDGNNALMQAFPSPMLPETRRAGDE